MIDYEILSKSQKFYASKGFHVIEAPWTVSPYADDITRPELATPFELKHNGKRLVASGEQSFVYLNLKGFLPDGMYQSITPCFRNESFDALHTKYFLKNELFVIGDTSHDKLMSVLDNAMEFFRSFGLHVHIELYEEPTPSYDIMCGGVELGSYGIRTRNHMKWIYGTGCAEPRLSTILTMKNGLPQN